MYKWLLSLHDPLLKMGNSFKKDLSGLQNSGVCNNVKLNPLAAVELEK